MSSSFCHALIFAAAIGFSVWSSPAVRADQPGEADSSQASAPNDSASATTEPSNVAGPGRRHRDFASPDDRFGGPMGREWHRGEPLTDEQWKKLGDFMKQNSPRRWERLQDLSDDARQRIGHVISRRYEQLQAIREIDPKVYDIRIQRMKIEDAIFGLGWQLTHDGSDKPESLESKLRQQVKALVENRLQERKVRIGEMQTRLNRERALLKRDESDADAAVAAHMKAIMENSKWPQLGDFAGSAPPPGAGHGPRGDRANSPGETPSPSITATIKKAD